MLTLTSFTSIANHATHVEFRDNCAFASGARERDRNRDAVNHIRNYVRWGGTTTCSSYASACAQRAKRHAQLVLKTQMQTLSTKFTNMVAAVTLSIVLADAGARRDSTLVGTTDLSTKPTTTDTTICRRTRAYIPYQSRDVRSALDSSRERRHGQPNQRTRTRQ